MPERVHSKITDGTSIPLGWVLSGAVFCTGALMAAGLWLGSLNATAATNSKRLDDLESIVPRIDRRLARIEGSKGIEAPKEDRFPSAGMQRDYQ